MNIWILAVVACRSCPTRRGRCWVVKLLPEEEHVRGVEAPNSSTGLRLILHVTSRLCLFLCCAHTSLTLWFGWLIVALRTRKRWFNPEAKCKHRESVWDLWLFQPTILLFLNLSSHIRPLREHLFSGCHNLELRFGCYRGILVTPGAKCRNSDMCTLVGPVCLQPVPWPRGCEWFCCCFTTVR